MSIRMESLTSPIVWDVAGIVPLTKKKSASSGRSSIRFLKIKNQANKYIVWKYVQPISFISVLNNLRGASYNVDPKSIDKFVWNGHEKFNIFSGTLNKISVWVN